MIVTGQPVIEWMREMRPSDFGTLHGEAIGWNNGKGLIAGVAYTDFTGPNICMHVVGLGKRWLTRKYLYVCFDYPFNQCKVRRVTGFVAEGNLEARRFDEHLGFERETTLRGAHPTGDLIVYVMWKDRCKWISRDFSRHYAKAA